MPLTERDVADHEINKYFLLVKPKLMYSMHHNINKLNHKLQYGFVTYFPPFTPIICTNLISQNTR
jgi:hypothetical protein